MSIYKFINHTDKKINSLLKRIIQLHPEEINLSLDRIRNLLKRLQNPQNSLPYAIHIAGTNGKGSVATSLYHLQKLNGKKVHLYRSPHLISINERILVANKIISNKCLYDSLIHVFKVNNSNKITFFEFLTATAFYVFSKFQADLFICEVGLGGKYDATNILNNKKKACIITSIGLDHKEYLGNSIKKISREKSGILKNKNILICSNQNKNALNTIKKASQLNKCRSFFYGEDWYIKNKYLYIDKKKINLSNLSLEGNHQYHNIGCVILACNKLKILNIENDKISNFIEQIKWEGRLHKLNRNFKKMYPDTDIWVDCAHNPLGFQILKKWVFSKKISNIIIILSIGIRKDYKGILRQIKQMNPKLLMLIKKNNFSSRSAEDLYAEASRLEIKCRIFNTISEVLKFSLLFNSEKNFKNTCLVAGSISLVGEFLTIDRKKI